MKQETAVKRTIYILCIFMLAACVIGTPQGLPGTDAAPTLFLLPAEWTPTPTLSPIPLDPLLATASLFGGTKTTEKARDVSEWTDQAILLMKQENYPSAIELWDKVILKDPENAEAYYQRATCYTKLLPGESYLERYLQNIHQALEDIDTAIALRGDTGDYYWLRAGVYEYISFVEDLEINREYLKNIALDNARKAIALGTTLAEYPELAVVLFLILTNRCEEALKELEPLLAKTPAEDFARGGLLRIQSEAFSCLGRSSDAIETVDAAMFNNMDMGTKKYLKSIYLYQTEQYDGALTLINEVIKASPGRDGERYYLRAAIYYAQGKTDLARRDLETGSFNTWLHFGLLPYVQAQIALDEDDKAQALEVLLYSEQTFDTILNPTRWKVQKQLAALGVTPLNPTPSVPYTATPIP
jgi:tetratricopeptide (TPR) repeat protein